jgi:hypothetical protein
MSKVVSIHDAADRRHMERLSACLEDFRRYLYQTGVEHGLDRADTVALIADEAMFWLADMSHGNPFALTVLQEIVARSIEEMPDNEDD